MIRFDEKNNIFKIDTRRTTYIIGLADQKYPGLIYYGKKLAQCGNLNYLLRTEESPYTPQQCPGEKVSFFDVYPMEYPAFGIGDFGESALSISDGRGSIALELVYEGYRIFQGKEEMSGLPHTFGDSAHTLEISLKDEIAGIRVFLFYSVFEDTDAVIRSTRIVNIKEKPVWIDKALSASLQVENEQYDVLTLPGSWARERHMERCHLGFGGAQVESKRGISSHQSHPFLALLGKDCGQTYGDIYAMHFVYSGNFFAKAQPDQYDRVRMVMGIHPEGFRWKLNPGEEFRTPEVVLLYCDRGLDQMTHCFHDLYRNHLIRGVWKNRERPVPINNWEATYFDFDSDKLLALAQKAAEAGIEMLVMDDGWFGKRKSEHSSLGDWYVNENKIMGGLRKLTDAVHEKGLKFGIWFEPEMISPDSDLFREHPDWALQQESKVPGQCRNQYVLDFSRRDVIEYIYQCLVSIISSGNIDYVKWDMNRPLTDVGSMTLPKDRQGELYHRHMLAVYELQERLLEYFPNLLLENCSSGGGRYDPGMLYYSPQIWCSDDMDAIERLAIQEGTALLYPLSTIGAHIGSSPYHMTGRKVSAKTRAAVAMAGTFGYEMDITGFSQEQIQEISGQIALHKKYRKLIWEGDYYRLASWRENHLFDCWQVVSKDQKQTLATFIQVLAEPNRKSRRIRLRGLKPEAQYVYGDQIFTGEILMNAGILIGQMQGDFTSCLIYLHEKGCPAL